MWGPSLTQDQLLRLQRLQNRAVRLVFSLNKYDHISEPDYQRLHWLGVSRLIQFRLTCVMYHQYNGARGIIFVPPIQFGNCTLYDTRTPPYYANLSSVRLSQTQKQVRYQGALVWSKLSSKLKEPISVLHELLWCHLYLSDFFFLYYILFVYCISMLVCIVFVSLHVCMYICPSNEEEQLTLFRSL